MTTNLTEMPSGMSAFSRRSETRLLLIGSPACPGLGLEQVSSVVEDIKCAENALTNHLVVSGALNTKSILSPTSTYARAALAWLYEPDASIAMRVLYYTGHATLLRTQETAFPFIDSSFADPSSLISSSLLHEYLANCPLSDHLWLLDCCFAQGMSYKRLPETVQSMIHHCVIASSAAYSRTTGADRHTISPFTKSFVAGIEGLAYPSNENRLNIFHLMRFLDADTARRGLPAPYLHYSGSGSQLAFQCSATSAVGTPLVGSVTRPRLVPPDSFVVAVGEPGDRTKRFAAEEAQIIAPAWNLDGRSRLMLGMSKVAAGFASLDPSPAFIEEVSNSSVWEHLLDLRSKRSIIATVSASDQIPKDLEEAIRVVQSPGLTELDLATLVSKITQAAPLRRHAPVEFLDAAAGSMDQLERLVRSAVFLGHREELASMAASDLSIQRAVLHLSSIASPALSALKVVAATPGIRIPERALVGWLSANAPAVDRLEANPHVTLARLVKSGLALSSDGWLMVPQSFSSEISDSLMGIDDAFTNFVEMICRSPHQFGLSLAERFQVVQAAIYYCETHIGMAGFQSHVDKLLSAVGFEVFVSVSRASWMPLIQGARGWLGGDASSAFLALCGHAYRLNDDYTKSQALFERAYQAASNRREKLAARTGLIRLTVQSKGAAAHLQRDSVDYEEEMRTLAADLLAGHKDRIMQFSAAQLLTQQGNSAFLAGDWNQAGSYYTRAKHIVEVTDASSASIMVDILKGIGDIAISKDDRTHAALVADELLENINAHLLTKFGRVPEAKALQFIGDVARRCTVPIVNLPAGFDSRRAAEARYWYARVASEYRSHDLQLGTLITASKMAELSALEGLYDQAFIEQIELADRLQALGNSLWGYRAHVAVLKLSPFVPSGSMAPFIELSADIVGQAVMSGQLSSFDTMWGLIGLASASGPGSSKWQSAASISRELNLVALVSTLDSCAIGNWLFAYYL